ncbi:MAG TPA: hypothetical protein VH062_13505 [Polyangiaceae bacterium]|jgi:hypothetical protein|nr:hypothetical protein [Polyangiaceae bacterium]
MEEVNREDFAAGMIKRGVTLRRVNELLSGKVKLTDSAGAEFKIVDGPSSLARVDELTKAIAKARQEREDADDGGDVLAAALKAAGIDAPLAYTRSAPSDFADESDDADYGSSTDWIVKAALAAAERGDHPNGASNTEDGSADLVRDALRRAGGE